MAQRLPSSPLHRESGLRPKNILHGPTWEVDRALCQESKGCGPGSVSLGSLRLHPGAGLAGSEAAPLPSLTHLSPTGMSAVTTGSELLSQAPGPASSPWAILGVSVEGGGPWGWASRRWGKQGPPRRGTDLLAPPHRCCSAWRAPVDRWGTKQLPPPRAGEGC